MLLDYLKRGVETEASQENEVHEIDRVNMEINLTDVTQNKRIKTCLLYTSPSPRD